MEFSGLSVFQAQQTRATLTLSSLKASTEGSQSLTDLSYKRCFYAIE